MKKKRFAPILIVLIIAILGVVGYFAYKNIFSTSSVQTETQVFIKQNPVFPNNYDIGDVWIKNIKTGEEKQLTTYGYNSEPKLSPDNKLIVYLSWPKEKITEYIKTVKEGYGGSLSNNIWMIQTDGTNAKQIIKDVVSEQGVSWSPNSQYFVTLTQGYKIFDVQKNTVIATIEDNDPGMENAQVPVWKDGNSFVYEKMKGNSLDSAPAVYNIENKTTSWSK